MSDDTQKLGDMPMERCTLRLWLIAAAINGLCANPHESAASFTSTAIAAVKMADAVIAELEKSK